MTATTHRTPALSGRTVRELIGDLAAAEDALRECRAGGATRRRDLVLRRQARIVRELRRRRGALR